MPERQTVALKMIVKPDSGPVVCAPPILIASTHTVNYVCGFCGAVLMHAEADQVYGLVIHCSECEAYNTTES